MIAYFVERLEDRDRLVQFNCHSKARESLITTENHILSLAVSEHILAVLENKFTGQKIVAQVANETFGDS